MDAKDNFNVYVGGKSGVFKGVKITQKESRMDNIQNLVSITPSDEVTTMSWSDEEENEILIACGKDNIRSIKVYDTDCSEFTCSFFCNVGTGIITGISRYDEAILTAVESGEIKLWKFEDEEGILINAGRNLDRMRHSRINKNIIATGGNEHELKLFDLEKQKQTFLAKNVRHDSLELRVPVWISDIGFLPKSEQVAIVGKYGHIRLYDPRARRRPVIAIEEKNEAWTTLGVTPRERQIIVGSGKGNMNLVDFRQSKILNTYKGFIGSVTGIACSTVKPYVVSVSLDRHLRIHHIDTKELLKKVYLTSRISCMLLRSEFSLTSEDEITGTNEQSYEINGMNAERGKMENVQNISDSEYDMLFDNMQVVTSKEDKKLIEGKFKKTPVKKKSLLNKDIGHNMVSYESSLKRISKNNLENVSKKKSKSDK